MVPSNRGPAMTAKPTRGGSSSIRPLQPHANAVPAKARYRLAYRGVSAHLAAMGTAAASLLVFSLALAVTIGPQMRMWSWGPSLLALAAALGCAAFAAAKERRPILGPGTLALGLATAAWIVWRALHSPVPELAHADLLLLGGAVGAFLVTRAIGRNPKAESIFLWGVSALAAANLVMIFGQVVDGDFSQFRSRPVTSGTGFYAHYNEGANFLIGTSFLLIGGALFGKQPAPARIAWLGIALLGLAAIWFTRSRGAVFGVVIGFIVLFTFILVIGSRRKATWFAPLAIAFPIILLGAGGALYFGWEKVQRARSDGKSGVVEMMDNTSRLRDYSLSFDAIKLNPAAGGGSRSYSWSSLQLWKPEEHGQATHLPEQTHNEVLQAATDYGLIGAGMILVLIASLSLGALWHVRFDEAHPSHGHPSPDSLRLGGMAALAGMLIQSSFSFVFHLMPGAMLLGIALGRLSTPGEQTPRVARFCGVATACLSALLAVSLLPAGIQGSRVVASLLPIYFKSRNPPTDPDRIARISQAIAVWPLSEFHHSRALIHHQHAVPGNDAVNAERLQLALRDYLDAARANPKFPGHFVNAANLLSLSRHSKEAEDHYRIAIRLQGNMEPAFRAHYHLAEHFRRLGMQHLKDRNPAAAIQSMRSALQSIQEAEAKSAWTSGELRDLRNACFLGLAHAHEAAGNHRAANDTLNTALGIRGNSSFRYHVGMLQYRHAMRLWRQRQAAASLPVFRNARNQLLGARNHPPQGVTRASIQEHIEEIDEILALLHEAGFRND